jgi:formate hydrogenlyase subunit 6/NADH:ubiquinone oxidoreductase subunit I
MVTHAFFELLKQFFSDPATNLFPVKHAPKNVHKALKLVEQGKAQLYPPVELPPGFRGKVEYDREACIGCQMCIKVCPSQTIDFIPGERKVKFHMSRCTFCALCTEICPKDCIRMSDTFIMATLDKNSKDMIVLDSGNWTAENKEKVDLKKEAPKAPAKA